MLALAELLGDGVEVDIMSRAVGDCIIASRRYSSVAQYSNLTPGYEELVVQDGSGPGKVKCCKRALSR